MPRRRGERDTSQPTEADALAFLNPQGTIPTPAPGAPTGDPLDAPGYTYSEHYPIAETDRTVSCDYCGTITESPLGPMDQPSDELKAHIAKQYRPFDITFVETPAFYHPERTRLDWMSSERHYLPPVSNGSCDKCNKRTLAAIRRLRARRARGITPTEGQAEGA